MSRIRPKKSLGQHFLHDAEIIRKIADAIPTEGEPHLIEIGPGTGTLTRELLRRFSSMTAVEVDQRAVDLLAAKFPDLEVIHEDILRISWDELLKGKTAVHVVGNLPYYITSQILFALLDQREKLQGATLMMQKEVAERLVASDSNKQYGILSVQTQLMSTPKLLFDVSSRAFSPPPKVTSSVVQIRFDRPVLACTDQGLKTVVRFSTATKKIEQLPQDVRRTSAGSGF